VLLQPLGHLSVYNQSLTGATQLDERKLCNTT
jgi:hypothetical protein